MIIRVKHLLLLILGLAALSIITCCNDYRETVTCLRVIDGDTFIASNKSFIYRVRIYGIDAPELEQPYGIRAKELLESVIDAQKLFIFPQETDKYGRTVAIVRPDFNYQLDIGKLMITNGLAWCYKGYCSDSYYLAFQEARNNNIGLWRDEHPTPPFKFRQAHPNLYK